MENFAALPGQTLFMSGIKDPSRGYVETFLRGNFLPGKSSIYGSDNMLITPSEKVEGKYYYVEKVWLRRSPGRVVACSMLLKEKESGEELYYKPTLYPQAMICTGYYHGECRRSAGQRKPCWRVGL